MICLINKIFIFLILLCNHTDLKCSQNCDFQIQSFNILPVGDANVPFNLPPACSLNFEIEETLIESVENFDISDFINENSLNGEVTLEELYLYFEDYKFEVKKSICLVKRLFLYYCSFLI